MKMVKEGVTKSLKPLCPYQKVEAETMAWSEKMKSAYNPQVGVFITALADGAYTKYGLLISVRSSFSFFCSFVYHSQCGNYYGSTS